MRKKINRGVTYGIIVFFGLTILIWVPVAAGAGPEVTIKVTAEKEITIQREGKIIVKRVKADKVEAGEIIFYTLIYRNKGDQKAIDVVVNNPIPKGTEYLSESVYGERSSMSFSIDGGNTYHKPEALRVSYILHDGKKMTRQAYASEYTHIRWVVEEVPPGASGTLGFRASVK